MIKLYKDGDSFGIGTDCGIACEFVEQFAGLLAEMVERGVYKEDWDFQMQGWLPLFIDLTAAVDIFEKTRVRSRAAYLVAGDFIGEDLVASFDGKHLWIKEEE